VLLQGVPVAAGRAHGSIHFVGPSGPWLGHARGATVAVLPADRWPPGPEDVTALRAALIQGRLGTGVPSARFPVVEGIDERLLREGDPVEVDGTTGAVTVLGVREVEVVTAFLEDSLGRVLLLRRSARVGSFQGRWAGVSGYLEDPTPLGQAYREILEETGLAAAALSLVREGNPLRVRDEATVYRVHPFRFRATSTAVRIDWEHTECEWVDPREIVRRPTVPQLAEAWAAVAAPADQNDNSPG
jgi:8-oxo-dGTP pyrophosphatase MutT (NUDIX family)